MIINNKNNKSSISRPLENIQRGLLQTPNTFISQSFSVYSLPQPPPPSIFPAAYNNHSTTNDLSRAASIVLSCRPINRKSNHYKSRSLSRPGSSITLKRSAFSMASPKKDEKLKRVVSLMEKKAPAEKSLSAVYLGPDSEDIVMDVSSKEKVSLSLLPSSLSSSSNNSGGGDDISVFNRSSSVKDPEMDSNSGSLVFQLSSPPPSSLPLPTFSLRAKLSCNAEAAAPAGIDAGATYNLRRLLQLQ